MWDLKWAMLQCTGMCICRFRIFVRTWVSSQLYIYIQHPPQRKELVMGNKTQQIHKFVKIKKWCESVIIKEGLITATEYHRMFLIPFLVHVCVKGFLPSIFSPHFHTAASAQPERLCIDLNVSQQCCFLTFISYWTGSRVPEPPDSRPRACRKWRQPAAAVAATATAVVYQRKRLKREQADLLLSHASLQLLSLRFLCSKV